MSDRHEDGARPPGYRLMLREMAADERPREKLKLRGSAALSDGELLAIILNTGLRGETVTDVSQRLLAHHGGLRGLFRLDMAELARVRGLGDAKAVRVKAALELGRRLAALSPEERPPVGSPEDAGQGPSTGGTSAENPGAVLAESSSARGWRRGEAARRPPQPPRDARDCCAMCSINQLR